MFDTFQTMDGKLAVELIFFFSSAVTIFLILKKPAIFVTIKSRTIRIDTYFLGALLGLTLIIIFGILDTTQILKGLEGSGGLNPFGVLLLFLSMVFMSIFLDVTGFFEYCARLALHYAGNDGRRLYLSVYIVVSLLTIFTSNDVIILTFTPFIYYFAKNAGIDPKPYLIAEFFAANTWSMMLYIGNPTNILLASAFDLKFGEYFRWMILPTLAAGFSNMALLYLVFRSKIRQPITYKETKKPSDAIKEKTTAALGIIILGGCIVTLAVAPYFNISMWTVAVLFGVALLVILLTRDTTLFFLKKHHPKKQYTFLPTIKRMPFTIIPFILALFITVEALRIYGITENIGIFFRNICDESNTLYVFVYGVSSTFSANVLNNIPMTVAYVPIAAVAPYAHVLPAVLATTIGSNLGANITPIGALAGIMWMSILRGKNVKITFKEFVKYGLLITPITLVACLAVLALEFMIF